jgi:hypothetical protein
MVVVECSGVSRERVVIGIVVVIAVVAAGSGDDIDVIGRWWWTSHSNFMTVALTKQKAETMVEAPGATILTPDSEGESKIGSVNSGNDVPQNGSSNATISPAPRQHDARQQELLRAMLDRCRVARVVALVDHTLKQNVTDDSVIATQYNTIRVRVQECACDVGVLCGGGPTDATTHHATKCRCVNCGHCRKIGIGGASQCDGRRRRRRRNAGAGKLENNLIIHSKKTKTKQVEKNKEE